MTDAARRDLELPSEFVRLNAADGTWLAGLPGMLLELAHRWSLRVGEHFPEIAYNFVAPAVRVESDGRTTSCVLKLSRRVGEAANEIAALRLWNGRCAARLIESDPDIGALLIERVEPGTPLADLADADDEAATVVTADVLRQLWETPLDGTEPHGLRALESWFAAYDRNREALSRGAGGFPAELFRRADAMRRDLLASSPPPSVLHGDMHHYNVLRDHELGWRAIDPKGLAGDRCFDVCQFMRNPRDRTTPALNRRRLDVFRSELGIDRERAKGWCLVHAVLDACWDFEGPDVREGNGGFSHEPNPPELVADGGDQPWRRAVARAEAALTL